METLTGTQSLIVQQRADWTELLPVVEKRNRYLVTDPARGDVGMALEQSGSTLQRLVLGSYRPFTMDVLGMDQSPLLKLRRPFRWYFQEIAVADAKGLALGTIRREFSILRRIFVVREAGGSEAYRLYGPILHPWTFEIRRGDKVVGRIVKKWSGLAKEALTQADNFGITFPPDASAKLKALLLGAVFLIDFVHFENSRKGE
jgi:hypothetical protein